MATRGTPIDVLRIQQKMGQVYASEDISQAHVDMGEGKVLFFNQVALVGALEKRFGQKKRK